MTSTNVPAGKSLPSASIHIASNQAGPSTSSIDSVQRPTQVAPPLSQPLPRKAQASRKQHRNQRRPAVAQRASSAPDDYDAMAELRAVRNPSSRRGQTSITHLLNYTVPVPLRMAQDRTGFHARSYRRNPTWGPGFGYHAADKSRYVHANYRFVVSPDGTYSRYAADANAFLDWSCVMQILASVESQAASCPICLSEPVVPRMARCGHIYCLPCLIRFMNSSAAEDDELRSGRGPRWKKCPICEDSIQLHEVRPVRFYAGQESPLPQVGDDVVLRLMARKADSTLALLWEGGAEVLNAGDDVPWHFAANVLDYARIMKGTADYMAGQFDGEIVTLSRQEKEDEALFGLDNEWTQKAIKAIEAAKEKLADAATSEDAMSLPGRNPSKHPAEADFYFYCSPSHLYLSPLDVRILKTNYGSFSNFPSTLLPRLEHISTGHVVDDALRRRAKYLGHLPNGCIVTFLECDWTDIVSVETLAAFSDEIERRRKRNRDKAAQEERERLQAEYIEAATLRGSLGVRKVSEPLRDEPSIRLDPSDFQPLAAQPGATPPDPRSDFATLASLSTSPSTQRTIWGTLAIAGSPELEASPSAEEDDGWLKDDALFGTAELAMELEAIEAVGESLDGGHSRVVAGTDGTAPGGSGKKGKKKQKITLMSTGGRRGN